MFVAGWRGGAFRYLIIYIFEIGFAQPSGVIHAGGPVRPERAQPGLKNLG